jgi:hypothetical protein
MGTAAGALYRRRGVPARPMTFSIQEVFAMPAFKKGRMAAIKKEVPPGSGRWFIFGFENNSKSSRNYRRKFMFAGPLSLDALPNRQARRQKLLLAKVVWYLLIHHNCHTGQSHSIDERAIPDLWNLTFKDEDEQLVIRAELLPEITDEQIAQVCEFLLGTKETMSAVIEKFKLPQPPAYLTAMIRDHVVPIQGVWSPAPNPAQ